MQDLGEASGGRREALGPGKAPSDGTCVEGSESAWGVEERGPQCPAQASTLLPPSSSQHRPQLPAGPAFGRCEKDFPAARESSNLASQCGSGQVLSTQPGFRVLLCSVQRKGRAGFAPQVLPSPGGLGLEGSRAHSAWNCSQSLPQSAWLLRAPPSLSARTCFLPSQRPPFISPASRSGSSTFSLLRVSLSVAGPHPQRPPSYPPAPDIGRGCPGPPWLGPFRACLGPCPNQQ